MGQYCEVGISDLEILHDCALYQNRTSKQTQIKESHNNNNLKTLETPT